jgi:hypothetical protein
LALSLYKTAVNRGRFQRVFLKKLQRPRAKGFPVFASARPNNFFIRQRKVIPGLAATRFIGKPFTRMSRYCRKSKQARKAKNENFFVHEPTLVTQRLGKAGRL